jgi:uncharacterized glyoxalase superfamily metalloenzyme YdcJ
MKTSFANKTEMQNELFAELSRMFGSEVPLYDKSLLINKLCNQTAVALFSTKFPGFALSDAELDRSSSERHGAIRIGKPAEYRWIAGYFAAFGMLPHSFYDMTNLGGKSQPVIATAFRSPLNPDHRVFTSLLVTDYFDPETRTRIEQLLAPREIFTPRAKELVERHQQEGGLSIPDSRELIRVGTQRIFKWTGHARDHRLYQELSKAGFKIAADIACFESHHLNHLTPNTFCMDLYTSAMKFCLGELAVEVFKRRAQQALEFLADCSDRDWMKLHFKHISARQIDGFGSAAVGAARIAAMVDSLSAQLQSAELDLKKCNHSGFKDFTEGPSEDTPVLLRQDSYKALTEPVQFRETDGSAMDASHTARFGEIEQRFYATTPKGRALYDDCLANADKIRESDPELVKRDGDAYRRAYADCFSRFPKTLLALLQQGLVFVRFTATDHGLAAARRGEVASTDCIELVRQGHAQVEGLRYEDFLPFSAAGIFASNLGQYGTKSTAAAKPVYSQATLENVIGGRIVDPNVVYRGLQAESESRLLEALGVAERVGPAVKGERDAAIRAYHAQRVC